MKKLLIGLLLFVLSFSCGYVVSYKINPTDFNLIEILLVIYSFVFLVGAVASIGNFLTDLLD
jgi:hypothetical protein